MRQQRDGVDMLMDFFVRLASTVLAGLFLILVVRGCLIHEVNEIVQKVTEKTARK